MIRSSLLKFLIPQLLLLLYACGSTQKTTTTKSAAPPPFGSLEVTAIRAAITGPTVEVKGWVLDSADPQPSLKLSVDGKAIEATLRRVARKDVCSANPSIKHCATAKPGFVVTLS